METISKREQELRDIISVISIHKYLPATNLNVLSKHYINTLVRHSILYHFDEQVANIIWDIPNPPSQQELIMLDIITDYLYSEKLFEYALDAIDAAAYAAEVQRGK